MGLACLLLAASVGCQRWLQCRWRGLRAILPRFLPRFLACTAPLLSRVSSPCPPKFVAHREAQGLLGLAASLGLPSPAAAVEEQLAAAGGNWEAAQEGLARLASSRPASHAEVRAAACGWRGSALACPARSARACFRP